MLVYATSLLLILRASTSTAVMSESTTGLSQQYHTEEPGCSLECVHGGHCRFGWDHGRFQNHCACPQGFTGTFCEREEKKNCGLECANGGYCTFGWDHGRFQNYCKCPRGFTGTFCEREEEKNCGLECLNGGYCESGSAEDGYADDDPVRNELESDDDRNDPERCTCPLGFTGKFCERQEEEDCGLECLNGGYCESGSEDGSTDDQVWNELEADDDRNDSKHCTCPLGFTGKFCEREEEEDCGLECLNGGYCESGSEDGSTDDQVWNELEADDDRNDPKRCTCPLGFTGKFCERESDPEQERDTEEQDQCADGRHQCLHGSSCVKAATHFDYFCDCTTADNAAGVSYAGRFCQYQATSYCGNQNPDDDSNDVFDGRLFCVNGGMCKDDIYQGCDCPAGFTGFSCEFRTDYTDPDDDDTFTSYSDDQSEEHHADDPNYIECDLDCMNGGSCRKGPKDHGDLREIVRHVDHLNVKHSENFEHCVCPPGFNGLRCEHNVERCDDSKHYCLHGSKCVKTNKSSSDDDGEDSPYTCDCSATTSNDISPIFAGNSCEHPATTKCYSDDPGPIPVSFCVNGGKCAEIGESIGCSCRTGWKGPHCEVVAATRTRYIKEASGTKHVISVGAVLALSLTVWFIVKRRKQHISVLQSANLHQSEDNFLDENPSIIGMEVVDLDWGQNEQGSLSNQFDQFLSSTDPQIPSPNNAASHEQFLDPLMPSPNNAATSSHDQDADLFSFTPDSRSEEEACTNQQTMGHLP